MAGKIRIILINLFLSLNLFSYDLPSIDEFIGFDLHMKIQKYLDMEISMAMDFTGGGSYDFRDYSNLIIKEGRLIIPYLFEILESNDLNLNSLNDIKHNEITYIIPFFEDLYNDGQLLDSEKQRFITIIERKLILFFDQCGIFTYRFMNYFYVIELISGNINDYLALSAVEDIEYQYLKYNKLTDTNLEFIDEGLSYEGYSDLVERYSYIKSEK